MKTNSIFLKIMVFLCLFLLLFSGLAIVVLYVEQTTQQTTGDILLSGFDNTADMIAELTGNVLNIQQGEAIILPKQK